MTKQMVKQTTKKYYRSTPIPPDILKKFKKHVDSFHTKSEAAEAIGVNRGTLNGILLKGTCSGVTLERIVNIIQ